MPLPSLTHIVNSNIVILFILISKTNKNPLLKKNLMNMPQKVRHYLGHFLWTEK
jgi:hypothetical protein